MKKHVIVWVVGGLLVFSGIGIWALRNFHVPHASHLEKEGQKYYCPMHPSYVSDKPGNCPICGMKLVPLEGPHSHAGHEAKPAEGLKTFSVEELVAMKPGEVCLIHKCKTGPCNIVMSEEFARLGRCPACGEDLGVIVKDALPVGYAAVELSQSKRQAIGVTTGQVTLKKLRKTVRAVGTVAHDPELYQTQAEYLAALANLEKARSGTGTAAEAVRQAERLVEASRVKLRHMGLSERLINEIAEEKTLDTSLLHGSEHGPVWVYAQIYEYEMSYVKEDIKARLDIPSLPGVGLEGIVRGIDRNIDPVNRTVRVRIRVERGEVPLKPGMYVNVFVETDLGEVLAVPKEAVFRTGKTELVFVDKGGLIEPREVRTGATADEWTEILSGLSEGESVVTSGNFLIDSESRLKGALESVGSGEHEHGGR